MGRRVVISIGIRESGGATWTVLDMENVPRVGDYVSINRMSFKVVTVWWTGSDTPFSHGADTFSVEMHVKPLSRWKFWG